MRRNKNCRAKIEFHGWGLLYNPIFPISSFAVGKPESKKYAASHVEVCARKVTHAHVKRRRKEAHNWSSNRAFVIFWKTSRSRGKGLGNNYHSISDIGRKIGGLLRLFTHYYQQLVQLKRTKRPFFDLDLKIQLAKRNFFSMESVATFLILTAYSQFFYSIRAY